MVRRFFISDDWVYNYEIGYAPLASIVPDRDPFEFATFAAESLALMSYGFEVADPPTEFQPKFLIASTKFRFHLIDGESSTEDVGAVVDEWAGTLQKVETRVDGSHSYTELGKYENVEQLAQLLYVNGAMVSSYDEALFADDSQCQETDGLLLADVQGGAAGPAAGMATSFDEVFDEMFSSTTNAFQNISPTSAKGATTEGGASE